MKKKLLHCLFLIIITITFAESRKADLTITTLKSPDPPLTRHRRFNIVIQGKDVSFIDKESFKILINKKDFSNSLDITFNRKEKAYYILFNPVSPLPIGKITLFLTGKLVTGEEFRYSWNTNIEPASDDELKTIYQKLHKSPNNIKLHFSLAKIFEKKFLLQDAYDEYLKVVELDPFNEEAIEALERIFAVWDTKTIVKDELSLKITLDESLMQMAKLILFNVKVKNLSNSSIGLTPGNWLVKSRGGDFTKKPVNIEDYPKLAVENGWLTLDEYTKLSFYLEKEEITSKTEEIELLPQETKSFMVAFPMTDISIKTIDLIVKEKSFTLTFPFVLMGK